MKLRHCMCWLYTELTKQAEKWASSMCSLYLHSKAALTNQVEVLRIIQIWLVR